jgi:uncharacterized protein with von Willebrand factor type A (vWA) domain
MSVPAYRYGSWSGGRDPLEPPYDVAAALDEIGEAVLEGASARQALRDLLRRGADGLRGLDDLRRQVAKRQRQARSKGQLDGTLQEVRERLEQALAAERRELFPDPSDAARMRELELDTLPDRHGARRAGAQAVRLAQRRGAGGVRVDRGPAAPEVLDSQFKGMKQALESTSPEAMQAVKDMLSDLNAMLEADARGEHTQQQFDDFMASTASSSRASPRRWPSWSTTWPGGPPRSSG